MTINPLYTDKSSDKSGLENNVSLEYASFLSDKNLNETAKSIASQIQLGASLCIDSRKITPGSIFVAIRGENFDGHDFIQQAILSGAKTIVHARLDLVEHIPQEISQWYVFDTIDALAAVARAYRSLYNCSTIAVTGSNGKTSVKGMIASILPKNSLATAGNLNNHIGVPLTVFNLQAEHRYAVFELGASKVGDIQHTVAIVQPNVALINNIAPAHLEGFGSLAGVVRAKSEIYQGLAAGKIAIVNEDDSHRAEFAPALANKQIIGFSREHAATICADDIIINNAGFASFTLITPVGKSTVSLQVPGMHHVSNALAAASCTYAVGIALADIVAGLEAFTGVSGRLTIRSGINHATIIDDTYNANLRSVLSAIDVLSHYTDRRILVLGDMGELGEHTVDHHAEIGKVAKQKGIDELLTCGEHSIASTKSFGNNATHYTNQQDLVYYLKNKLDNKTTVLVKGSRSSAMENVVRLLVGN